MGVIGSRPAKCIMLLQSVSCIRIGINITKERMFNKSRAMCCNKLREALRCFLDRDKLTNCLKPPNGPIQISLHEVQRPVGGFCWCRFHSNIYVIKLARMRCVNVVRVLHVEYTVLKSSEFLSKWQFQRIGFSILIFWHLMAKWKHFCLSKLHSAYVMWVDVDWFHVAPTPNQRMGTRNLRNYERR